MTVELICAHPKCKNPADSYITSRAAKDNLYCSPACRKRDTDRLKQKRRRDNHPLQLEYERAYKLYSKYKLTINQWNDLYSKQLGRCAICHVAFAGIKTCVDHNHVTGKVRGLLCVECNHGIGKFKDNPYFLRNAADYLEVGSEVTGE